MKQIIIINDSTPEAEHAAKFALAIAMKMKADLLLANTIPVKLLQQITVPVPAPATEEWQSLLFEDLVSITDKAAEYKPVINELDISEMNETQLAEFIHMKGIGLIVKGEKEILTTPQLPHLNIQSVLNKVCCPILLVPEKWQIKDIEHIVYLADLRYCRTAVVSYLVELAGPFNADIAVSHFSAKGLPNMGQCYAEDVFNATIGQHVHYESLYFNNTKERDLSKAVDVLINGMHNDLLVVVNHRYHFEEIIGRYITDAMPQNLTVPVMVFPY